MTDRKAMQQALEALQKIYIAPEHEEYIRVWWPACEDAITALRERLAQPLRTHWEGCEAVHPECKQPEQEPVAWVDESAIRWLADRKGKTSAHCTTQLSAARSFEKPMPIYTAPPRREWVGLTDEELEAVDKTIDKFVPLSDGKRLYARAIEAKLKEKNT